MFPTAELAANPSRDRLAVPHSKFNLDPLHKRRAYQNAPASRSKERVQTNFLISTTELGESRNESHHFEIRKSWWDSCRRLPSDFDAPDKLLILQVFVSNDFAGNFSVSESGKLFRTRSEVFR
jgi:hypothetical protein